MQMISDFKTNINSFHNMQHSTLIETILNSSTLTLELLMENDIDMFLELKNKNINLIIFFTSPILSQVIKYITREPEVDDYNLAHKFPFICNEIILCEVSEILDIFFHETQLLDELFGFLERLPINQTLAGYFCSVVQVLLKHNSYELLSYIHDQKDISKLLTDHSYSTSIMQLIYKLLSCEDHGNPAYVSKLYDMVDYIVYNLVQNPSDQNEKMDFMKIINSSNILCSLTQNHNEVYNWSDIQMQASGSPNIELIIGGILQGNLQVSAAATAVVISIIRNIDTKQSEDIVISSEIPQIVEIICEKTKDFKKILNRPGDFLGMDRLNIVKMLFECSKLNYEIITKTFIEVGILKDLVELVVRFPWNSMLHIILEDGIIFLLLKSEQYDLKKYVIYNQLIQNTQLIQIIIESSMKKSGEIGYLGWAIKIANVITKISIVNLRQDCGWEEFVNEYLMKKNHVENCTLGQGEFIVKSENPEIEIEEFFDAIQGPDNIDDLSEKESYDFGIYDIKNEDCRFR
ncbi:hypothetical protein SteCoe_11736 [Stentor coeruleus]|uniref:Serine/threonine-protein phosphatase 4 regulatory subunit 3-like central domain-containing protein n=1 Tax=Stentor coeruleus TaxID=5963 RepID=A0A1R2CCH5_9CILI|nr:hypothetical protein SteCoe_11736 [Stentor coeruleus]